MKQSSTGLISGQPARRRHDKSERAPSKEKAFALSESGRRPPHSSIFYTGRRGLALRAIAIDAHRHVLEQTLSYSSLLLSLCSDDVLFSRAAAWWCCVNGTKGT